MVYSHRLGAIWTSPPSDIGSNLDDYLLGNEADNTITGNYGNDWIDGGAGVDTAVFLAPRNNYLITTAFGKTFIAARDGGSGFDTLLNIEKLQFTDMTVNLGVQTLAAAAPAANVQRLMELYVAFFNRVPDADGMAYWIGEMQAGRSINQIADIFYGAGVQFSSLTGFTATMTNTDFINVIYKNVLGRNDGADAGGLAYWNGELTSGRATRGSLVSTILDAAHSFKGDSTWGWVANLLDNKIAVAKAFSIDWGLGYASPDDAIKHGMGIAAAVTPTDTKGALNLVGINGADMSLF